MDVREFGEEGESLRRMRFLWLLYRCLRILLRLLRYGTHESERTLQDVTADKKSALLFFFFYFLYYRVISHELPGFVVSVDYFVIAQMSPVFPMRVGGDFKICKRPQRSYDTQRDYVPHPPLYALFVSHPPEFPL